MKIKSQLILLIIFCYINAFSQTSSLNDSINRTDSKGLKQGKWIEYFESKKIKSEAIYKDNQLNGLRISYYLNGKLETQLHFVDGKKHGTCKFFHENGKIKDFYIMDNDNTLWHAAYDKNGMIESEDIYKNSLPDISIVYKNGVFLEDAKSK